MPYGREKCNWYTCFDPCGSVGNVHYLIIQKQEHVAGRGAQAFADALGQPMVTMKKLHPKAKPYVYGDDDDKRPT